MKQIHQNKSKEIHGLLKIPDSVIIKSQAVEIGKLTSYIDELKFELRELNRNNLIKRRALIDQCENLVAKNKKLENQIRQYKSFIKPAKS